MLTDFHNLFNDKLGGKFATKAYFDYVFK